MSAVICKLKRLPGMIRYGFRGSYMAKPYSYRKDESIYGGEVVQNASDNVKG